MKDERGIEHWGNVFDTSVCVQFVVLADRSSSCHEWPLKRSMIWSGFWSRLRGTWKPKGEKETGQHTERVFPPRIESQQWKEAFRGTLCLFFHPLISAGLLREVKGTIRFVREF